MPPPKQLAIVVFAAVVLCAGFFSLNGAGISAAVSRLPLATDSVVLPPPADTEEGDDDFDPAPRTTQVEYNILQPKEKYFVYSPTGGLSNQLIELAIALEICTILKRKLIAPMIGRHSSGFRAHEELAVSDLFPMDRIIDFAHLQHKMTAVPLNVSVPRFVSSLNPRDVHTIYHIDKHNWVERDISNHMSGISQKVLYLRGKEMYHPWFPAQKTRELRMNVRFAPKLREIAVAIVQQHFPMPAEQNKRGFNAMHIRLGDYTVRWPTSSAAKSKLFVEMAFGSKVNNPKLPLYLATDEPMSGVFVELKNKLEVSVVKNLPAQLVKDYRELFPPSRIRLDMLGVLDQLVCSQAASFVSSEFSTFSESIRLIRSNRKHLFPESYKTQSGGSAGDNNGDNNDDDDEAMDDKEEMRY
ncbi:hypothetical protein BASA81_012558 [Batrachochytrium salamandrivorans]|nr:hypothetical protein BASA81_012558 [Batrachochytrium salamandrivorans]